MYRTKNQTLHVVNISAESQNQNIAHHIMNISLGSKKSFQSVYKFKEKMVYDIRHSPLCTGSFKPVVPISELNPNTVYNVVSSLLQRELHLCTGLRIYFNTSRRRSGDVSIYVCYA